MATGIVKKKPVFTTVGALRPDTSGHNLTVKVGLQSSGSARSCLLCGCAAAWHPAPRGPAPDWQPRKSGDALGTLLLPRCLQVLGAKIVLDRPARPGGKPQRIAECTVGDATGIILFTARNEQGELGVCWAAAGAVADALPQAAAAALAHRLSGWRHFGMPCPALLACCLPVTRRASRHLHSQAWAGPVSGACIGFSFFHMLSLFLCFLAAEVHRRLH